MFAAALLLAVLQPAPPAQEEAEIVVTAVRRGECRVTLADRTLSSRELAANATRWAAQGRAVRVVRPAGASYDCMARIARRLNTHGVRLLEFVNRSQQR